jgi:hypothetical protein
MPKRRTIPVTLPPNFVTKLGFRSRQRFIVVFWEPEISAIVCYDGVKYQRAKDQCAYVALCCREDVAPLLEKHRARVGWAPQTVVTHWLVIDQQADQAFFMRVGQAYRLVSPQKPILEPTQQRLPFGDG